MIKYIKGDLKVERFKVKKVIYVIFMAVFLFIFTQSECVGAQENYTIEIDRVDGLTYGDKISDGNIVIKEQSIPGELFFQHPERTINSAGEYTVWITFIPEDKATYGNGVSIPFVANVAKKNIEIIFDSPIYKRYDGTENIDLPTYSYIGIINNEITIVDSTFDGQWYYTFQHASSLKAIEQFHGRIARSESTFWDSGITAFPALNMTGCEELWGTFAYCYNLATCPLIDTSSVQGMGSLFKNSGITVIPSFNTHNVTDFADFAAYCYNLTAIPDLDVSSATDIEEMFFVTPNVQSGMLNMYQKLSALGSQITSPTDRVFALCGVDGEGHYASEQARLERAQIPTTWGGDMQ
jgi:hypothetical protein